MTWPACRDTALLLSNLTVPTSRDLFQLDGRMRRAAVCQGLPGRIETGISCRSNFCSPRIPRHASIDPGVTKHRGFTCSSLSPRRTPTATPSTPPLSPGGMPVKSTFRLGSGAGRTLRGVTTGNLESDVDSDKFPSPLILNVLNIFVDHEVNEIPECCFGFPAQQATRLGCITD